jgi:hypothetical protein
MCPSPSMISSPTRLPTLLSCHTPCSARQVEASTFSSAQLRDLFSLHEGMPSHLYDKIRHAAEEAERSEDGPANSLDEPSSSQEAPLRPQNGWPKETGDMHLWAHHTSAASVDDEALRRAVRHSTPETGGRRGRSALPSSDHTIT